MGISTTSPKIIVNGGGLGGLSAANALQQVGIDVSVYERATELKEMGAGIVLAANAMKALDKLGIGEQVRRMGSPVKKAEIRTWDGKLLLNLPVHKQAKRYGTYSYLIHRADLQRILYGNLKPDTVFLGRKLVRKEQNTSKIRAIFENKEVVEGDLLIGADGVHSQLRRSLIGSSPLRYSGFTAFRGISHFEDERFPIELGGGFEAWGPGKRFGYSHLGKGRIFWFAAINTPLGTLKTTENRKNTALDHFKGWWGPIEGVIESTEEANILTHEIFDKKPIKSWSKGMATLLGDAAHPMLPNLGQGGAQALEDAIVLSRCIVKHPEDIQQAVKIYERIRIPRTAKVVRGSRAMGKFMQLENPISIQLRNVLLRTMPDSLQIKRLEWLIGYEV
ncbi:2-polyprenyl-6-methoxyphenol hydroxylase [Fictibacillus phosphorivorans]|uniref:2-polyprenyl-6-methoxyphenol hydroxylase n=1 Tax=Fictibacillus phosphorivorans TaxID=1221500 RepID=A0A163PXR4_9BACL|nr:FAD-dependent monooxygenase [Fictibacillus phosphorivorans]KZE64288.1 2-polyprenyl-6-methoxyphenol hydroxylase [Fictibacillus phosphorivorans]